MNIAFNSPCLLVPSRKQSLSPFFLWIWTGFLSSLLHSPPPFCASFIYPNYDLSLVADKLHCSNDFPGGSDSKASAYRAGDLGSIHGSGRSPGEGNGNPLWYSCPPPHKKGAPRNVWKNQGTSQNSLPSSLLNKLIISHIYWISIICQRLWCAWSLSHIWLFAIPWTVAHQAPLSIGILQARTLEWVAMPSSRGSYQPRDWAQVSCIADSLPSEPPGKPMNTRVGSLSLLWGIFPSQGSNWGLLHCKLILYQLW